MPIERHHFTTPLSGSLGFTAGFGLFRLSLSYGGMAAYSLAFPTAAAVSLVARRVLVAAPHEVPPTRDQAIKAVLLSTAVGGAFTLGSLATGVVLMPPATGLLFGMLFGTLLGLTAASSVAASPSLEGRVRHCLGA